MWLILKGFECYMGTEYIYISFQHRHLINFTAQRYRQCRSDKIRGHIFFSYFALNVSDFCRQVQYPALLRYIYIIFSMDVPSFSFARSRFRSFPFDDLISDTSRTIRKLYIHFNLISDHKDREKLC